MLHGHEEGVEDDADRDGQVQEGIHHHELYELLQPEPVGAAPPDEVLVGEDVPAGVALLLGFLQLCDTTRGTDRRAECQALCARGY